MPRDEDSEEDSDDDSQDGMDQAVGNVEEVGVAVRCEIRTVGHQAECKQYK